MDTSAGAGPGEDMDWETLPDELEEDQTFVHAARDIIGSW